MGEESKIQWTDNTFNPWIGCTKVSPGCAHCYAAVSYVVKMKGIKWGKGEPRHRTSVSYWKQPLKWNNAACAIHYIKQCEECPRPRVFCASLADWLDDEVPIEWLADLLKLIHDTPNLDWQLLTKRPENWLSRVQAALWRIEGLAPDDDGDGEGLPATELGEWVHNWIADIPPANVWIGATVENQEMADKRIPELLSIPARVRFLSCEPLLGEVNIKDALRCDVPIHWVIIGGESGTGARTCELNWIQSLVDQCKYAGVSAFVKQLGKGAYVPAPFGPITHPKGGDINEWPNELRVREFPRATV